MPGAKTKGLLFVLAAVGIGAGFAAGLPGIARHVPWGVERWIDRIAGGGMPARRCLGAAHPEASRALAKLVGRLYPLDAEDRAIPISVDVVAGDAVNAYAGLGGQIHVFQGLLKDVQSPDELAGVIAHEIAHVRGRHIMQALAANLFTLGALTAALPADAPGNSRIAYTLLTLRFSRQQEAEADEQGLRRLRAARVDAAGFGRFFARAGQPSVAPQWLSSHPANEFRAELARQAGGYPTETILDSAGWQALGTICR